MRQKPHSYCSFDTFLLSPNKYLKLNFDGGDLSSDAGLLLIKEFACKLGFANILKKEFKTNDCADELTNDPILTAVLAKKALSSQPTLSRFFNRLDDTTLNQFYDLMRRFRKVVYSIKKPELLLRGDSGFTKPELYHQCETNGVSYAIRLKENGNLRRLASYIDEQLTEITKDDYAALSLSPLMSEKMSRKEMFKKAINLTKASHELCAEKHGQCCMHWQISSWIKLN